MPAVPACAALSHSAALLGFGYSYGTEAEVSTIRALGLNLCRCIPASGFKLAVCKWKVVFPQRLELLWPVTGKRTTRNDLEKDTGIARESFAAQR